MGSQLQSAKTKFSALLTEIQPVVAQFVVWLDEKVAEYKVIGHMNLDSGPEAPKWIKDYSMSLLVSGVGGGAATSPQPAAQKSRTPTQARRDSSHRSFSHEGEPPPKKLREPHPAKREYQPTLEDDDFEIIEIKQEKEMGDEYLKSWSQEVTSADNIPSCSGLADNNVSLTSPKHSVHPASLHTSSTLHHRTPSNPNLLTADNGSDDHTGFDMSVESFDESNLSGVENEDVKPFHYQNVPDADSNTGDSSFPGPTDSPSTSYYGMPDYDPSDGPPPDMDPGDPQAQDERHTLISRQLSISSASFDANKHSCRFCGKIFLQKGSLQRHERIHTGERPYKCSYCERRFTQKGSRQIHERLHTGERPYKCRVCGKGFAQIASRQSHETSHTENFSSA